MATKTLLILIAFSLLPAFLEAQVTLGRDVRQEILASSEAGEATATLSVTQVPAVLPGGRVSDGSIIALFVPSSRLFWWMHQKSFGVSDPEKELTAFLDSFTCSVYPDQIACFSASGKTFWVQTSEMRVSSIDEGISKVHQLLPAELPRILLGEVQFQQVSIAQAVGVIFPNPKGFGEPPVKLKVSTIDRSDSGWRIEIRNDRGESKTVIVSRDFQGDASASK